MSNNHYKPANQRVQGHKVFDQIRSAKVDLFDDIDVDYDLLEIMLDELDAVSDQLGRNAGQFVGDMRERFFEYGYDTYVSGRQYSWLQDLFMRHVSKERRKQIFLHLKQQRDEVGEVS